MLALTYNEWRTEWTKFVKFDKLECIIVATSVRQNFELRAENECSVT